MDSIERYFPLSDEQLQGVDAACEAFERALQGDHPVRIEDCLAAVAEDIRAPLFRELLAIELERHVPSERPAQLAQYQARFPDRLRDVEWVFFEFCRTESECDPVSVSVPGYEIEGVLGRGGMGVVYKARHLTLKRIVALKMMLAHGHAGPHELARFRIEAEAAARLQHPNIVQIHEIGEADGNPYCALEFVEGGSLASKLDGKPMPAKEAAKLLETLARAMQLAHSRNVVHRDLKPANILLTSDGTPKITDFGLARQIDNDSGETMAGTVMGTPSYMAPEQASGLAHEAGPAADVYSRLQAGIPLDLETICLKCLRKEPENR